MLDARVIENVSEVPATFEPETQPRRVPDARVLMVDPEHYDVVYAINPHMEEEGELRRPDRAEARRQWESLRRAYEVLGYEVVEMPGEPGLPDMVFVANVAVTVGPLAGRPPRAVMSRMACPERERELVPARKTLAELGLEIVEPELPEGVHLEGHGDLLWFSNIALLFGGHGFRTDRAALDAVAALVEVPVLGLRLVDPLFYHLDTCLMPLDETRAAWVPDAFDERGRALLERVVPKLIEVPGEEAATRLAANGHCVDGRNVIIDAGATRTMEILEAEGFAVHPVDTSEYLKAGGSVFCMKLMLPPA